MPPKHNHTGIEDPSIVEERIVMPSTLETIDKAMYDYIDDELNIFTTTNKGWKKVPVVWLSAERAHQIKNDNNIRDAVGKLKLPIVTVERSSLEKDKTFKGNVQAHLDPPKDGDRGYRNGSFRVISKINQEKTRNFQSAEAKRKYKQSHFPVKTKKIVKNSPKKSEDVLLIIKLKSTLL